MYLFIRIYGDWGLQKTCYMKPKNLLHITSKHITIDKKKNVTNLNFQFEKRKKCDISNAVIKNSSKFFCTFVPNKKVLQTI